MTNGEIQDYIAIDEMRDELADIRGRLRLMYSRKREWAGSLEPCVGGITCVVVALHGVMEEMKPSQ